MYREGRACSNVAGDRRLEVKALWVPGEGSNPSSVPLYNPIDRAFTFTSSYARPCGNLWHVSIATAQHAR